MYIVIKFAIRFYILKISLLISGFLNSISSLFFNEITPRRIPKFQKFYRKLLLTRHFSLYIFQLSSWFPAKNIPSKQEDDFSLRDVHDSVLWAYYKLLDPLQNTPLVHIHHYNPESIRYSQPKVYVEM